MDRFYLDNNATTKPTAGVLAAVADVLSQQWGNPSGAHALARGAREAVEAARKTIARSIGADPREIIFTSGGTESNATAITAGLAARPGHRHIITSEVEHPSVLRICERLQQQGTEVTQLPVDTNGQISLLDLEQAIRPDTALVSLMWANNETGVLFPVEAAARLCRQLGVLFHTDGVQAFGKVGVNVQKAVPDFMSLSGHKIRGIKGTGALYVRRHLRFRPLLVGGHQEAERRAGTENVPGIVAFGVAAATLHFPDGGLRDRLERGVLQIAGTQVIAGQALRVPNTTNICFQGVSARELLGKLDRRGLCASSGSACATGSPEPSHVLTALGLPREDALSCIRFSLAADHTAAEIDRAVDVIQRSVAALRTESSLKECPCLIGVNS